MQEEERQTQKRDSDRERHRERESEEEDGGRVKNPSKWILVAKKKRLRQKKRLKTETSNHFYTYVRNTI